MLARRPDVALLDLRMPKRTGDQVTHTLHGLGRVVAVSADGKDLKVIVDFPNAGRKTILAKFLRQADDQLN